MSASTSPTKLASSHILQTFETLLDVCLKVVPVSLSHFLELIGDQMACVEISSSCNGVVCRTQGLVEALESYCSRRR